MAQQSSHTTMIDSGTALRDYIETVVSRAWLVLGVLLLAMAVSLVYALTRTPLYTASATVEFEDRKSKSDERLYGMSDFDQSKGFIATQAEILKSRTLVEALIAKMNLLDSQAFAPKTGVWDKLPSLSPSSLLQILSPQDDSTETASPGRRIDGLVNRILAGISVKQVKTSNLVSVSLSAENPALAREMLETYLSLYLERNLEKRRMESLEASSWLKDEAAKAEKRLFESQSELVAFVIDNGIVTNPDGGLGQVMDLINRSMEGRVRSHEARLRMQALKDQKVTEQGPLLPKDVQSEYIGKLREQLALYESEYSQMQGLYSPNYPKLEALHQKIKFLRDRIAQIERDIVSSALDTAKKEESLFRESWEQAKAEADRVKSLEARHAVLRKEVETNTDFHKMLIKEYKEQEIRSRTISNNVRVVDPPTQPLAPSRPKKGLIVLAGTCIGLFLGVGLALAADRLDQRVTSPDEIERVFNVPRLAVVPDLDSVSRGNSSNGAVLEPEFIARNQPKSPMGDAIRTLQTSIFLGNLDKPVQSMVISSANPAQGKTLIAISTASVLCANQKKVVVVDADMRRPRLHKVFGMTSPGAGLSDVVLSQDVQVKDVLQRSSVPGLYFITSGSRGHNPVDTFRSEGMTLLVKQLRRMFHYIIFDAPPVLGFSDAQLLCLQSDGIIMVARQGRVIREELREALSWVSNVDGCRLLGVVLNQAQAPSRYGYRYGLGGYHYYGYSDYYRSGKA